MRKTVDIDYLIHQVNDRNKRSTCDPKVRKGWNSLLESILLNAGVYEGFGYYTSKELGSLEPGIRFKKQIFDAPGPADDEVSLEEYYANVKDDGRYYKEYPDTTRRYYYVGKKLTKGKLLHRPLDVQGSEKR